MKVNLFKRKEKAVVKGKKYAWYNFLPETRCVESEPYNLDKCSGDDYNRKYKGEYLCLTHYMDKKWKINEGYEVAMTRLLVDRVDLEGDE